MGKAANIRHLCHEEPNKIYKTHTQTFGAADNFGNKVK